MGCAVCGGGGRGARQAAQNARIASANAMAPGLTPINPIILGDVVEGEEARKVRVLKPYPKVVESSSPWVAGSLVDSLIDEGVLHDTQKIPQSGRVWTVPGSGRNYVDYEQALRIASALGTTPKEIA